MLANYSTIDAVTNAVCAGSYQPYKIKLTIQLTIHFLRIKLVNTVSVGIIPITVARITAISTSTVSVPFSIF